MIEVDIPGYGALSLRHLVCDFNGTLALDGKLIDGVAYRISELSRLIHVHILTADTYGTAKEALALADGKLPIKTKFTVRRDYVEATTKA